MTVVYIAILLLLLYGIFCAGPALVMFRSVFVHRTEMGQEPKKSYYIPYAPLLESADRTLRALSFTEVSLVARDGITLRADYSDRGSDRTAILFHGYRATPLTNCLYQAALFADAGYNILLVHQRAHGKSEGRYCTLGHTEQLDTLAWIDLAANMPAVAHIVLYGVSMGAVSIAFASDKIAEPKVRAMVLDCGFSSIYDQLSADCRKLHVPRWTVLPLLRLMYRYRFGADLKTPVTASLAATGIPALFLHGTADESVPLSQGEANYAACASPKQAYFIPDAAHTCVMMQGGDEAKTVLWNFLDESICSIKS